MRSKFKNKMAELKRRRLDISGKESRDRDFLSDEKVTECLTKYSSTVFACETSADTRYIKCDFPCCTKHLGDQPGKPPWLLNTLRNVQMLEKHVGSEVAKFMKENLPQLFDENCHIQNSHIVITSQALRPQTKKVLAVFNLTDPQSLFGEWIALFLHAAQMKYGCECSDVEVITQFFSSRYELMSCITKLEFIQRQHKSVDVMAVLSCHSSSQGQVFSCSPTALSKRCKFEEFCSLHDFVQVLQDTLGQSLSAIHVSSCFTLKLDCSHQDWPVDVEWLKKKLHCTLSGSTKEVYETGSQVADLYVTLSTLLSPQQDALGCKLASSVASACTYAFPDLAQEMGLETLSSQDVDRKASSPCVDEGVSAPSLVNSSLHVVILIGYDSNESQEVQQALADALAANVEMRRMSDVKCKYTLVPFQKDGQICWEQRLHSCVHNTLDIEAKLFFVALGSVWVSPKVNVLDKIHEEISSSNRLNCCYGIHFQELSPMQAYFLKARISNMNSEALSERNHIVATGLVSDKRSSPVNTFPVLLYMIHLAIGENGERISGKGVTPAYLKYKEYRGPGISHWTLEDVYMETSYVLFGLSQKAGLCLLSLPSSTVSLAKEEICSEKTAFAVDYTCEPQKAVLSGKECANEVQSVPTVFSEYCESRKSALSEVEYSGEHSVPTVLSEDCEPYKTMLSEIKSELQCDRTACSERCEPQKRTLSEKECSSEPQSDITAFSENYESRKAILLEQSSDVTSCSQKDVNELFVVTTDFQSSNINSYFTEQERIPADSASPCDKERVNSDESGKDSVICSNITNTSGATTVGNYSEERTCTSEISCGTENNLQYESGKTREVENCRVVDSFSNGSSNVDHCENKTLHEKNDEDEYICVTDDESERVCSKWDTCDDLPLMANVDEVLVTHYVLNLGVNFDAKVMSGHITLFLKPTTETVVHRQFQLCLDCSLVEIKSVEEIYIKNDFIVKYYGTADSGNCSYSPDIFEVDKNVPVSLPYTLLPYAVRNWCIRIWKPSKLGRTWPRCVRISYCTRPEGKSLTWSSDQDGRPCVYSPGAYINNRSLMPCQEPPIAMSTWQAAIHVPAGCTVLMSGNQLPVEKSEDSDNATYLHEMNIPLPCSTLALAIGWFECRQTSTVALSCPVECRVFSAASIINEAAQELLPRCSQYVSVACQLLGPYPFTRLDLVVLPRCFACMGLMSPNMAFLSQSILARDGSMCTRVAHEISHSWFGLLIGAKDWSEEWLSEGFATYMEERIMCKAEGLEDDEEIFYVELHQILKHRTLLAEFQHADENMQRLRPKLPSVVTAAEAVRRSVEKEKGSTSDDVVPHTLVTNGQVCSKKWTQIYYLKGYFLLHHMASLVGVNDFDKFLKEYVVEYGGKLVNSEEFFEFFEKKFTFLGMEKIKDQLIVEWLERHGLPVHFPKKIGRPDNRLITKVDNEFAFWKKTDAVNKRKRTQHIRSKKPIKDHPKVNDQIQVVVLLERLLERETIATATLTQLDNCYHFAEKNAEVRHRWCELVVKHRYQPGYPQVRRFLIEDQGMGIYLFGELLISQQPKQKQLVLEVLSIIDAEMDQCTFKTVQDMLEGRD